MDTVPVHRNRRLRPCTRILSALCPENGLLCRLTLVIALLSAVCAAVLSLTSGFSSDDYILLLSTQTGIQHVGESDSDNNNVSSESISDYLRAPRPEWPHFFRPGSRIVQHLLFLGLGQRAVLHHLVNLLLHVAICVLVVVFACGLGASRTIALWCSFILAIHPIHVEPVIWIAGMPDLGMTLLYIIGLLAYLRHLRRPDRRVGSLVVACGAASILLKECGISFPLALAFLATINRTKKLSELWPIGMSLVVALAWYLWRGSVGTGAGLADLGLSPNPLTWGRNLLFYGTQFLLPVRSMFRIWGFESYYNLRHILAPTPHALPYMIAVVTGLTAVSVYVIRRWKSLPRIVRIGVVLGCIGILPFLAYPQSGARFLYLGSIGWSLAVAGWLFERASNRVVQGVFFVWVTVMSFSLVERATAWYDAGRLSKRVLEAAVEVRQQFPPEQTTVFTNLPSRFNGAYVFSSGFPEAVILKTGLPYGRVVEYGRDIDDPGRVPPDAAWFAWNGNEFESQESE